MNENRNAQPVNLIYVPASPLNQQTHHPSVVLQELRSLQYHDKSPLVILHPLNVPLQTNSVSWPSKYQADKYLPPDEPFSRLFVRSSQPAHHMPTSPLDAFFRRFELPIENNFIGNQPFYQNSNLYHHRYTAPHAPLFSSNVPLSANFPPLPYVSPSLRGYKSETTTPPGDIDVRMSALPDEFAPPPPPPPSPTQTQIDQPDNGLLNRAATVTGSERDDVEEITESARIEQRNFEESSESPVKYEEATTEIVNGENQQENNDGEELNVDNGAQLRTNVSAKLDADEFPTEAPTMTTTSAPAVTLLPAQSDENLIDSSESSTIMTTTETSETTTNALLLDETTTTMTVNTDDEMMTTTVKSS